MINKIIKETNPKKATGQDKKPPKIVQVSVNIPGSHLISISKDDKTKRFLFQNVQKLLLSDQHFRKKCRRKLKTIDL